MYMSFKNKMIKEKNSGDNFINLFLFSYLVFNTYKSSFIKKIKI